MLLDTGDKEAHFFVMLPHVRSFYASGVWKALRLACLVRANYKCTVSGCRARATHADHIVTRPRVPEATTLDRLDNLRALCAFHDSQVKELSNGSRRRDGEFTIPGCRVNGMPVDPAHPWAHKT